MARKPSPFPPHIRQVKPVSQPNPFIDIRTGQALSKRQAYLARRFMETGERITQEELARRNMNRLLSRAGKETVGGPRYKAPPLPMTRYKHLRYELQARIHRETGEVKTIGELRSSPELKSLTQNYRTALYQMGAYYDKGYSYSQLLDLAHEGRGPLRADGALARALVQLGRRRADATYPVGETPK